VRFDKIITLCGISYSKDEIGQEAETTLSRDIYANEFNVSASEFYAAGREGLKPAKEFQVRAADYADEKIVISEGVEYRVVRTTGQGEFIRLILEVKVGANSVAVS
jgi:hypothetical protein